MHNQLRVCKCNFCKTNHCHTSQMLDIVFVFKHSLHTRLYVADSLYKVNDTDFFFYRTIQLLRSDASCHYHGNGGQSHAGGGAGADG